MTLQFHLFDANTQSLIQLLLLVAIVHYVAFTAQKFGIFPPS